MTQVQSNKLTISMKQSPS